VRSQFRFTAAVLILGAAAPAGSLLRAAEVPKTITITARRFEFSPKEITLKQGETVRLQLTTEDVTHGFFLKPLGIDEDIVPGKTTEVVLTPKATGRYTTICDHFCGAGHGGMKMTIVVVE
jgi:cytochrome c oxidase subunit 2